MLSISLLFLSATLPALETHSVAFNSFHDKKPTAIFKSADFKKNMTPVLKSWFETYCPKNANFDDRCNNFNLLTTDALVTDLEMAEVDFNNDGKKDAIIMLGEQTGMSFATMQGGMTYQFYENTGKSYKFLGQFLIANDRHITIPKLKAKGEFSPINLIGTEDTEKNGLIVQTIKFDAKKHIYKE